MNHRITSLIAYTGSVVAATLAAALMSGKALAEGPLDYPATTFVSTRSRADVKAELMQDRGSVGSYAIEWRLEQGEPLQASGYTTAQARAAYLASRDEVRAMNAEDSGSSYMARSHVLVPANLLASRSRH